MRVARHNHVCLVHSTPEERRVALSGYMRDAFARNERFLYIVDQDADTGALEALQRSGLDIEDALDDGALIVKSTDQTYLEDGTFDPDRMIERLRAAEREALADGFSGLAVSGEMTWAQHGAPGSERLLEYETRLNDVFPKMRVSAVCQYDTRRFPRELIAALARAHPLVMAHNELVPGRSFLAR